MAREKTSSADRAHVIEPIAVFQSPFATKFGVPRQSGLSEHLRGRIKLLPPYNREEALRGLEDFSHLWLIWGFSANKGQGGSHKEQEKSAETPQTAKSPSLGEGLGVGSPEPSTLGEGLGVGSPEPSTLGEGLAVGLTVRPPRLGGNKRLGVFATRSPFRPNGLGLSSVKIVSVGDGEIEVAGADLMDGTPIYDIKPYLPYADSHPQARGGFTDSTVWQPLRVVFPDKWRACFSDEDAAALTDVLALDPRPHYHDSPERIYGMAFAGRNVLFKVEEGCVTVVEVTNNYT
ncbi:MAG: TrmO family methyltransferase [Prevotella sp.]|nr:TrmO family methyltransferase [Prevotella sp.]